MAWRYFLVETQIPEFMTTAMAMLQITTEYQGHCDRGKRQSKPVYILRNKGNFSLKTTNYSNFLNVDTFSKMSFLSKYDDLSNYTITFFSQNITTFRCNFEISDFCVCEQWP